MKFKITKLSKETFEKFEHMLKLRQSKTTLDIRNLTTRKIKFFMPYFSDFVDIERLKERFRRHMQTLRESLSNNSQVKCLYKTKLQRCIFRYSKLAQS